MFATIWVYGGEGRGLNWRILGQHAGEVGKHGVGLLVHRLIIAQTKTTCNMVTAIL